MSEIPLPSAPQVILSLYGYFLPLMLYAAWSTLAFWDLGRRTDISAGRTGAWVGVVLLVPFFGALVYHLIGGSGIPKTLRAAMVGGGLGLLVLALALGSMIGGAS